ncbi:glycosyltransferase family 4 protein [Aristophania vespae]|uniref:glycosyltransferase family 4 protein n=1 Tax=Aristophania vespae TaxID=2697033 RepID=UPI0023512FAD|nr:glycosyltransferase family 1 protein [Aristophania vespae]UMM64354.1 hypothetical protein DM15PD_13680 [Aristophania vespae]
MKTALPALRVWLDGRNIGRTGGTGIHYYALGLQHALESKAISTSWLLEQTEDYKPRPPFWRLMQALLGQAPKVGANLTTPWGSAHLARDLYRIAHVHYRHRKHLLTMRVTPPLSPPSVMHWTSPLPIYLEGTRNVVTIHDIIPLTHPNLTGIDPQRFERLLRDLMAKDTYFVTVSETVRQQILTHFSLAPERITTLYQSVGFDEKTRRAIKEAPSIAPAGSFLIYGRVEHRKNIETLLEAHALRGTSTPLVIIGPDGDDRPDCTPRSSTSNVIRLPWSSRLSLLRTLSEAKALLFPTKAEGFGLPIIEAMALNTPVLTSKGGVTEEIAGKAAILADPDDVHALAESIKMLDQLSSEKRHNLVKAGQERAAFFHPEPYAHRVKTFYEKLLQQK